MALFDDLRSAWGARPPKAAPTYVAPSRRTEFMNHWNGPRTGLTAASDHSRCLAVVKADQDFHMDGRGWNDIGYNGLVCPHGRAIECRGIDYVGAHCPDHNTSAYGWQFALGKGETATPVMFDRMAQALADCEDRSGHDLRLLGHRDGFSTECPGDQIEAWVKAGMPGTTAPPKEWDEMATKAEVQQAVTDALNAYHPLNAADGQTIRNDIGYIRDQLRGDLSKLSAQQVADAIPDNLAQQVVDLLGARLNTTKGA